jgi:hypothetical protein
VPQFVALLFYAVSVTDLRERNGRNSVTLLLGLKSSLKFVLAQDKDQSMKRNRFSEADHRDFEGA